MPTVAVRTKVQALLCVFVFAAMTIASAEAEVPKEELRETIRAYILENPGVIVEALEKYELEQIAIEDQRIHNRYTEIEDKIERPGITPVLGNSSGDVVLVEFFDYRCGYCKRAAKHLESLVKSDSHLKVIMKEYPILSPESVVAARASLAAYQQGAFEAFHFTLMDSKHELNQSHIFEIARSLGLDMDRFLTDMASQATSRELLRSSQQATTLEIKGTPQYFINGKPFRYNGKPESLVAAVQRARKTGNAGVERIEGVKGVAGEDIAKDETVRDDPS